MTDIHPIFAECCAEGPAYNTLGKTFHRNGYLYATDGAIVVRQKHRRKDTPGAPDASSLQWPVRNCKNCHGKTSWVCGECQQNVSCSICENAHRYEKSPIELKVEGQISEQVEPGYYLDRKYLRMLHKYDAKVFLPVKLGTYPVYFTIVGGIEGLLMPRSKSK